MIKIIGDTKRPIKIWASDLEDEAEKQIRYIAELPFIHSHVAVMPDAHAGRGSTIGTVIATHGAIIPAAVGVDIGCGMCAVRTPLTSDQMTDLAKLRHSIERSVPTGRDSNRDVCTSAACAFSSLGEISETGLSKLRHETFQKAAFQIGSLGGGNHFIEICLDEENNVWVMLHSGSRNIGKSLADIHIDKAKSLMKEYFISLPDPDLAYLSQGTEDFQEYLHDLMWAQAYARANRNEMMKRILKDLSHHVFNEDIGLNKMTIQRIDCHHNYTSIENHYGKDIYVTRKGAISAKAGEWGIIPGSMGAKSFIVQGLGNPESFQSCSHGAGRKMSRTKAKQVFSVEDLRAQTAGIECKKDSSVLDEIPGCYKDIDLVMRNQADLVKPIFQLKQIICVKGST